MMLQLNGKRPDISEVESGKINEKNYSVFEKKIIEIIQEWKAGVKNFHFQTSGSTGQKKTITLSRRVMEYSAQTTLEKLDPKKSFNQTLVCVNPEFIGGTMAVIRALVGNHDITFVEPSSQPLTDLRDNRFDLASMVPLQVQTILDQDASLFENINTVIIGGASIPMEYVLKIKQIKGTSFFHSYGMTETASHIAMKHLGTSAEFETLGDIQMQLDERNCLRLNGTVTQNQWLQTNDIVDLKDDKHFSWLGRADNIINTGGVKVSPETVESKLEEQIAGPFFVGGINDNRLGQKVILLVEGSEPDFSLKFDHLDRYERPKKVLYLPKFRYTASGKIDRIETIKLISQ